MSKSILKYVKILFVLLMLVLNCMMLFGCKKQSDNKSNKIKFKTLDKDQIVVCSDNFDLVFPKEGTTEYRLRFIVLGGKNINKDDIKVRLDDNTITYNTTIEKEDIEELQYYEYLSYTDVDWNKMVDLNKKDQLKLNEYEKNYIEGYEKLTKKDMPKYNAFLVDMVFDRNIVNKTINKVDIECKGKHYTLKGNIIFSNNKKPFNNCEIFEDYPIAFDELSIYPDKEGGMLIDSIELQPDRDIMLTDVRILDKEKINIDVKKVCVDMNGDTSINKVLKKGDNIPIQKDANAKLYIYLKSDSLKKSFTYTTNPCIIVDYVMDGKSYTCTIDTLMRTKLSVAELYAKYVDKKNVEDYYNIFHKQVMSDDAE